MEDFWESVLTSSVVFVVFIVIALVGYGLLSQRGIKRQKKHFAELHEKLAVGQKVMFANGLLGTLKRVGDETVDIKIKSGEIMEVSRFAISEIVQ
jgi:preprotein translocase subunit YajC